MNKEELHLIVLWENARYKEREILDDIQKNLEIIECIEIEWTRENVPSNFTRFYGIKLDKGSHKEKECGTGKFLVVTVVDRNPVYGFVETSRGHEFINKNIFSLKEKYRKWTKGGHKIHATNTISETNHDICLLLGTNYDDYIASAPKTLLEKGYKKRSIKRDLTGCDGWKSLDELFYTLNATSNYVALRGFENSDNVKEHPNEDIDIICDDYENVCFIVNGQPQINKIRPHFLTKIKDGFIYIDIWNVKNGYYDKKWLQYMLKTKVVKDNICCLNDENAFFEFIYHCTIHKQALKSSYYTKADELYKNISGYVNDDVKIQEKELVFDYYFKLLRDFMQKHNYNFVRPEDTTVFYNEKLLNIDEHKEWLVKNYHIENIECYKTAFNGGIKSCYYKGNLNGNRVFIKYCRIGEICRNEYKMMQKVYEQNKVNFVKPYYYKCDGNIKNIVMEFLEGDNLADLIEQNKLSENQKETIVSDLEDIAKSLLNIGIVHRDIRPQNLILAKDGHLKLIDFQFAVEYKRYREDKYIRRNPKLIKDLGCEFAPDMYRWDDFYSISKILELLDKKSEYIEKNINKYVIRFFCKKFLLNKIFSIKKIYSKADKIKIITILGFKIMSLRKN